MRSIRWSERAIQELAAIVEHLDSESAFAGNEQAERIWSAVDQLLRFPFSGPRFSPKSQGRVLTVPRTPYLIYYEPFGDLVSVTAIRHGAQAPVKRFPR